MVHPLDLLRFHALPLGSPEAINAMALTASHFQECTIKDFYEFLLYTATKEDYYLDIMIKEPVGSAKYIDAKALYNEWEASFNAAREALEEKYGKAMRRQIIKMIDKDLELIQMRKKIFG